MSAKTTEKKAEKPAAAKAKPAAKAAAKPAAKPAPAKAAAKPAAKAKAPVTKRAIVKVAQLGDHVHEVAFKQGMKVSEALKLAQTNAAGKDIKVNGKDATLNTVLASGDTVSLVGKIKGG